MADLFLIYARARNGTIGRDNALPWHIPADLKHFKALTLGKPMIMGRKTFESFPSPLPGRRHIVLTRDAAWAREGAEVAHDVESALAMAGEGEVAMAGEAEIAIVGGAEIYALFEPLATRVELTEVDLEVEGDAHMPPLSPAWREVARESHPARDGRPAFAFVTLLRDR